MPFAGCPGPVKLKKGLRLRYALGPENLRYLGFRVSQDLALGLTVWASDPTGDTAFGTRLHHLCLDLNTRWFTMWNSRRAGYVGRYRGSGFGCFDGC